MIFLDSVKNFNICNLSNQININSSDDTDVCQLNYAVFLGVSYLKEPKETDFKIPVSISVDKSGELSIESSDENMLINRDDIRIYSDKKTTHGNR